MKEIKQYFDKFWEKHPYKSIYYKNKDWNYITCGNKNNPAIVLIHGGFCDAAMWAYQIEDLEKDYHIIAPTFLSASNPFKFYCDLIDLILETESIDSTIMCGLS